MDRPLKSVTHGQCDVRPTVTFPAAEHHRPSVGTKLYCLVTEAHGCEQLAQSCYPAMHRPGVEPATYWSWVQRPSHYATEPPKSFEYPLLSQERVKLRTSNFVRTFIGSIGTKAHENVGNSGRGRSSQGVPKIFRALICRAYCAVIFAITQLSCCIYYLVV